MYNMRIYTIIVLIKYIKSYLKFNDKSLTKGDLLPNIRLKQGGMSPQKQITVPKVKEYIKWHSQYQITEQYRLLATTSTKTNALCKAASRNLPLVRKIIDASADPGTLSVAMKVRASINRSIWSPEQCSKRHRLSGSSGWSFRHRRQDRHADVRIKRFCISRPDER